MEFREWVQQIRKERGLDAREFALITGVDPSTISRIENQKTEVTLYTAFRICESMGVSLSEFIYQLVGKHISLLERKDLKEGYKLVTLLDVEKLVDNYKVNRISTNRELAHELYEMSAQLKYRSQRTLFEEVESPPFYCEDEIERYIYWSPLSALYELKYPQEMTSNHIFYIYEHNGALMFRDVEVYLRKSRFKKSRLALPSLNRGVSATSMERIRLADVLQLYSESEDAIIVEMFWEASRFYSKFSLPKDSAQELHRYKKYRAFGKVDSDEWRLNLAIFYTTIHRWRESLDFGDF